MVQPASAEAVLVAGIPFSPAGVADARDLIITSGKNRVATPVRFMNAWSVVCAHKDPAYLSQVSTLGVNFADGKPLPVAARLRGSGGLTQVRGPSIFRAVLDQGRSQDLRHLFLGSTPETLSLLCEQVEREFPGACVVGTFSPPFAPVDESFIAGCITAVEKSDPDVIWVGLGTPKQDSLAVELARRAGRPAVAVGAAFDFVAGTAREAPSWMRRLGLEWLFRLLTEPRRLWRRYLIGNFEFLWLAATR